MKNVLSKMSLVLPMLLSAYGYAGEPLPASSAQEPSVQAPAAQQPIQQQQPSQKQAQMIQQLLEKSAALVLRVPLDQSMQQIHDQADIRVVTSAPLQMSQDFDAESVWNQAISGEDMGSGERFGFLFPFFRWGVAVGSPYIYNSSFYGRHYPYYYYNYGYGNPYYYYYDRPSHYGRFNNYDYYYYHRRW